MALCHHCTFQTANTTKFRVLLTKHIATSHPELAGRPVEEVGELHSITHYKVYFYFFLIKN
jgi:hypothetical protein